MKDPNKNHAEDPFSGIEMDLHYHDDTQSTSKSLRPAIVTAMQVALASLGWVGATNTSTAIANEGIKGVKKIRLPMISSGLAHMFWYNLVPVELAITAQKKIIGDATDLSKSRLATSVLVGASAEAAIGNPLDFLSLSQLFHSFKLTQYFTANPSALTKFSREELLEMMPRAAKTATIEELRESAISSRCAEISFTPKNLEMIGERTAVKLTLSDSTKAIKVMFGPSTFRNLPFYMGLAVSNNSEQGEAAFEKTATIALGGALATTIPNNATYIAATNVVKGQEPMQAFCNALIASGKQLLEDPKRFAILAGIRSLATLTAIVIFSENTRNNFHKIVDEVSNSIAATFGIETPNLTEKEKTKVDADLKSALQDPALQQEVIANLKTVDLLDKTQPNPQPFQPQETQLATEKKSQSK